MLPENKRKKNEKKISLRDEPVLKQEWVSVPVLYSSISLTNTRILINRYILIQQ
jgi:hypothetical protein